MAVKLDEIDLILLSELQQDADRTNVELARIVGLSPAGTLNRVRRLKSAGVIRQISRPARSRRSPGFPLQVYVSVTLARHEPRASKGFEDAVRAMPQVIAADWVAGEIDAMLLVVARDVAELQRVLARLSDARRPAADDAAAPGGTEADLAPAGPADRAVTRPPGQRPRGRLAPRQRVAGTGGSAAGAGSGAPAAGPGAAGPAGGRPGEAGATAGRSRRLCNAARVASQTRHGAEHVRSRPAAPAGG